MADGSTQYEPLDDEEIIERFTIISDGMGEQGVVLGTSNHSQKRCDFWNEGLIGCKDDYHVLAIGELK